MDSILNYLKKYVGGGVEHDHFEVELITHINSVFADLWQMGVGPSEVFMIEDDIPTWEDFLQGSTKFNAVKTYMELRVKIVFDPPTSSAVMEAMKREIDKWEWRLTAAAETKF